jgi:hypothetical protein
LKNKKILFFSPYSIWKLHFQFEVPLAWNLIWRGHDVRFFTCDGLFPICDLYQHAISGERPANACESCQLSADVIFKEYGLVNSKLGKYKNDLPDFMVFLGYPTLPTHWEPFANFWFSAFAVLYSFGSDNHLRNPHPTTNSHPWAVPPSPKARLTRACQASTTTPARKEWLNKGNQAGRGEHDSTPQEGLAVF